MKSLQEAEDMQAVKSATTTTTTITTSSSSSEDVEVEVEVEAVQFASQQDYYAMLGIPHLARIATHEQIRRACK